MSGESSCVPASPTDSSTQDGGGIAIGVFGKGHRGGRKDMEDVLAIVLEFGERGQAFVAVFDGHGGEEAALYAKDHSACGTTLRQPRASTLLKARK